MCRCGCGCLCVRTHTHMLLSVTEMNLLLQVEMEDNTNFQDTPHVGLELKVGNEVSVKFVHTLFLIL